MCDNYDSVKIKGPTEAKLRKLAKTGKISFTNDDLIGDQLMFLHPMNAKIIKRAQKAKKGVNAMSLTGGEINYNMMNGGGIWDVLKKVGSTIYKAVSSDTGKKIIGTLADVGVPALTNAIGLPEGSAQVARDLLKNITGVGLKEQRIANLVKARAARASKKGGSFRMSQTGGSLTAGSFMI